MNTKSFVSVTLLLVLTMSSGSAQQAQFPSPAQAVKLPQAPPTGWITVNILGQVNYQSRIYLPSGATLLDAIASAGGFTKIANPSKVTLLRKTAGERPDSLHIDLKPIIAGTNRDVILRDGDTIIVGEATF